MLGLLDAARLGRSTPLSNEACNVVAEAEPFQRAALSSFLLLTDVDQPLLSYLESNWPREHRVAMAATGACRDSAEPWASLWRRTRRREDIPAVDLDEVVESLTAQTVDRDRLAAWLVLSTHFGLTHESQERLTMALVRSGDRFDGRTILGDGTRLIRRYPTGSVSEKVALTLPPLISLARERLGIASPVIVARSLGFAGGTWDKLATLPGFRFADAADLRRELLATGIAYVVPKALCPADRELYSFRGATGTVDTPSLIVPSIAAKHVALPVHHLLLDMQVGPGGYVRDLEEARRIAGGVARLAEGAQMTVSHSTRPAEALTGTCMGAAVELWEGLAVLGAVGAAYSTLDARAVERQREVTAAVFAQLVSDAGLARDFEAERQWGLDQLQGGAALAAAERIYVQHGVSRATVDGFVRAPPEMLGFGANRHTVRARRTGTAAALDLRALGTAANVLLGAGRNRYLNSKQRIGGLQLRFLPGDLVETDSPLACCWSDQEIDGALLDELETAVVSAIKIESLR